MKWKIAFSLSILILYNLVTNFYLISHKKRIGHTLEQTFKSHNKSYFKNGAYFSGKIQNYTNSLKNGKKKKKKGKENRVW